MNENEQHPELCATCPNRTGFSRIVAKVGLGPDYTAKGCAGSAVTAVDVMKTSSGDGSISTTVEHRGCGNPAQGGDPNPGVTRTVYLNGEAVSRTNPDGSYDVLKSDTLPSQR